MKKNRPPPLSSPTSITLYQDFRCSTSNSPTTKRPPGAAFNGEKFVRGLGPWGPTTLPLLLLGAERARPSRPRLPGASWERPLIVDKSEKNGIEVETIQIYQNPKP